MVRELCFYALYKSLKNEAYLSETIAKVREGERLDERDLKLLEEIAYGVMRRLYTLDAYLKELTPKGKLKVKLKERILLYMALYQFLYLDKIPLYAIGQEMAELAKKKTHSRFVPFLNALIRRFEGFTFQRPKELWQRYSVTPFFLKELEKRSTEEEIIALLEIFNRPPLLFMRRIDGDAASFIPYDPLLLNDKRFYVQNPTPAHLMKALYRPTFQPRKILDFCAAPGGKTLLLRDLFPNAELFVNDPSEKRLKRLENNLKKYEVQATLFSERGELFESSHQYDLILLDVPCSNSGVLHKRVEARYRITKENLKELTLLQKKLVARAESLLSENGEIWYMTCSILDSENEEIVQSSNLDVSDEMQRYLPNHKGEDGGFGAILKKKKVL
ncbi:MAG: transcription antitermination factor NusB [Simkaniaceae bacterium]